MIKLILIPQSLVKFAELSFSVQSICSMCEQDTKLQRAKSPHLSQLKYLKLPKTLTGSLIGVRKLINQIVCSRGIDILTRSVDSMCV